MTPAPAAAAGSGSVAGTVTDAATTNPVANVEVCAFRYAYFRDEGLCTTTDGSGSYALSSLEAGEYHVWFHPASSTSYAYQYYHDASTWDAGQGLVVSGSVATGIDAALKPGGTISGTATAIADSTSVAGVEVCAYEADEGSETLPCVTTDGSGAYTFKGLPAGSYKVEFTPTAASNYARQYYNTVGDWDEATDVSVSPPTTTSGINAHLRQAGRISGRVTDSSTSLPIQNIHVCARVTGVVTGEGLYNQCVDANSNGEYVLAGLASLYYDVWFTPLDDTGPNYVREYYNNRSFFYEADAIQVEAPNTTTNVNAALDPGGIIEGTVDDHDTSVPVSGVEVCAHEEGAQGDSWGCTKTNASGEYKMVGLASKQYRVTFWPPNDSEYLSQVYDESDLFYGGDLLTMTAPNVITDIDGHLRKEGVITGSVTDEDTGDPVASSWVCAYLENFYDPAYEHCTRTDASGNYRIARLGAGEYSIEFDASQQGYEIEHYDNQPFSSPDMVSAEYGTTTLGINAALTKDLKPISQLPPDISGTTEVGGTLTCSTGTWANSPTHFAFQWWREGDEIPGATTNTYIVQPTDLEKSLSCEVTAENSYGTASATEWTYISPGSGPPEHHLTVSLDGSGTGSVTSSPAGINCGVVCVHSFDAGAPVTLLSHPESGSTFTEWRGACSGSGSCVVNLSDDLAATAVFTKSEEAGHEEESAEPKPSCATVPTLCPSSTPTLPATPPAPSPQPSVGITGSVATVDGGIALLESKCVGQRACQGTAKLSVATPDATASKAGAKRRTMIGKGRFKIPAGKRGTIRIKLTGLGKRLVKKAGKHGLRAKIIGTGIKPRSVLLSAKAKPRRGKQRGA